VLVFLRFVGVISSAVWLGALTTFTLVITPGCYSTAMLRLLPVTHAGASSLILWELYFRLGYLCSAVAIAHLVLECLYAGKSFRRVMTYLVGWSVVLTLLGGAVLLPRLQGLHLEAHGMRSTSQQRERAGTAFRSWQVVAQAANVATILGLAAYVWLLSNAAGNTRFVSATKFRGLTKNVT
jgi:hypothetical protein